MNQAAAFGNYLALVVDDERIARTVAIHTLSKLGFEVIDADDGEAALEKIEIATPDIILLDVEMENMDGLEACQHIRATTQFANTPIIMMTAHDDSTSIDKAFEAGATDFVSKPVNWTLLRHKIKYVMRNQEILRELSNAERISRMGNWRQLAGDSTFSMSTGMSLLLGSSSNESTDLLHHVHSDDRELLKHELAALDENRSMDITHRMIDANQKILVVQHRAQSVSDHNGVPRSVIGTIEDITEKEQTSLRVHQLAYYDQVTGMFNRTAIMERLDFLVNADSAKVSSFTLLHIDIDNFKRINDSLGPEIGDQLLRAVATRINEILDSCGYSQPEEYQTRENIHERSNQNIISRMGADAFAILLVDDWQAKNVEHICRTLVRELRNHYQVPLRQLTISVSIGAAIYPEHGSAPAEINQNADTAMHSVKLLGKNDFKIYDSNLSDVVRRKMQLEDHLRLAIENGELTLHYQPQIEISTLKVVGAEALLRWKSKVLGHVSPADFIPLAEEVGLIVPIGNWVLRTACEQLVNWHQNNINLPRVAVNISVRQFSQDDFVEQVSNTLNDSGMQPKDLELEITESLLAVDVNSAIRKLEQLKELGVEISVDDFGTGYSSLSYLKKFPIDRLKIDQSFIRDIDHDNADIAITRSIIGLARGLSLSVIAEGVETTEHLAKLTELGCDEAQGYLIGKPIPYDDFVDWLKSYEELLGSKGMIKAA